MTIVFLIKNREKPAVLNKRFVVVWVKRLLTFPGLIKIILAGLKAKLKGAKIGKLSVIECETLAGDFWNLEVGDCSYIGKTVNLTLHDKVYIGSQVVINNGVQILTASHSTKDSKWTVYSKPIKINDFAWIATNAILLPGVSVGKGAVVGAGAVVCKDVPDGAVVTGNPAKIMSNRCGELFYNPVALCAPYEAWLGSSVNYEN